MANRSLERSVDSLQKIYAVIVALAIGKTLQESCSGQNWDEITTNFYKSLPALLSFFFLIVPFYHGMNRHLDNCYLEKKGEYSKIGLLIDFFFFCIESSLLFIFANFIKLGKESFIILGIILTIDIFWSIIAHLINYKGIKPSIIFWAGLNLGTVIAGIFIYASEGNFSINVMWLLFVIILLRTVIDYAKMRKFYFPDNTE